MIFFKPKTEEEKIEKELKSMERDFRFNKLSRKEVECLYFAKKMVLIWIQLIKIH